MYEVVLSNRFRRDLKLAARRGCDLALLNDIVEHLAKGEALAASASDAIAGEAASPGEDTDAMSISSLASAAIMS